LHGCLATDVDDDEEDEKLPIKIPDVNNVIDTDED